MADVSAQNTNTNSLQAKVGLSSENYCYLKCWVALVRVGKQVLTNVFLWGCPDHSEVSLKDALGSIPGYSATKYKNDFNKDDRQKIENGSLDAFDITLLNTLIQRLCLKIPPVFNNNSPKNKLSDLVLEVKNTRNKFAHSLLGLSETEMKNYINEMRALFETVIREAEIQFNVAPHEALNLKNDISSQLDQIIDSPLPAASIEDHLKQLAQERRRILVQEAVKELQSLYASFGETSVTPWPFAPLRKQLSEIFVKYKLKKTEFYCLQNQLSDSEAEVDVDNLLVCTHLDSGEPSFILVTGQTGVGKTTLMKYFVNSFFDSSKSSIANVDQFDLIFYLDCRETCATSLNDFLMKTIPNAANLFPGKELKDEVFSLKCLFLLDNLDEIRNESFSVVNDVISGTIDFKIIASATQDLGNQITQKAQHRRPLNLVLEGLPPSSTFDYVSMLHNALPEGACEASVENFSSILSREYLLKNWLSNPEILSHIFFSWCLAPCDTSRCSTLTHILLQSFNLILKKLRDRLSSRTLLGVMELHALQEKLQNFLLELGRIALNTSVDGASRLGFKSTSQLLIKCQELGLPANVLLSEFLCFRETLDEKNIQASVQVSFPSLSFQEFCSAYHLNNLLLCPDKQHSLKTLLGVFSLPETASNKCRVTNIVKFLVGLLAAGSPSVLALISDQIIDVLQSFCEVKKPRDWLQILEEAQGHETFTKGILKVLDGKWQAEDHGISSLIVQLVRLDPPQNLSLVSVKDPRSLPHFVDALNACQSRMINLSLLIYFDFWKCGERVSDDFLIKICSPTTKCVLENFAGRISPNLLSTIPKHIKRLALRVLPEEIPKLNLILRSLIDLQLLSLHLVISENSGQRISSLCLPPNVMLSLDIFGLNNGNLQKFSAMVVGLYPRYTRLGLRRTELGSRSAKNFFSHLGQESIRVDGVVIGSTLALSHSEKVVLESSVKRDVSCKNFKWIHI